MDIIELKEKKYITKVETPEKITKEEIADWVTQVGVASELYKEEVPGSEPEQPGQEVVEPAVDEKNPEPEPEPEPVIETDPEVETQTTKKKVKKVTIE